MFQIAIRAQFQYQVDVFLVAEAVEQFDYVRMFDLMMNGDFCIETIEHRR